MINEQSIDGLITRINLAFKRSSKLLSEMIVDKEDYAGWRQFLTRSTSIGTYGTACGLIAYSIVNPDDISTIKKVANTIVKRQRKDGSWESPTIIPDCGLTTATCYSVIALKRAVIASNHPALIKAGEWLRSVVSETGAVGNYYGDSNHTLICSVLSMRAMALIDLFMYETEIRRIVEWLYKNQNQDGGFGPKPGSNSTLHHTAEVLISLSMLKDYIPKCKIVIEKANVYLLENWLLNQNMYNDLDYVEISGRLAMLPHHYQTDGLLLQAISSIEQGNFDKGIQKLIEHLIETQTEQGYWVHQSTPDKIPSWALMECLLGLNLALSQLIANKKFIVWEIAIRNMQTEVKSIKDLVNTLNSEFTKIANVTETLNSIYRYRYVLIAIYIASIYIFLRSAFSGIIKADIIGFGLAAFFVILQLIESLKNK
jgi:hypothetical protein